MKQHLTDEGKELSLFAYVVTNAVVLIPVDSTQQPQRTRIWVD